MKKTFKHLIYLTILCLLLIGFLSPAISKALISNPGGGACTVAAGCPTASTTGGSTALCFDQPLGQVFHCGDVTGRITTASSSASMGDIQGAPAGTCYAYTGGQDSNGGLLWVTQPDCSAGAFAGGATCPPPDAAAGYSCKFSTKGIDPCAGNNESGCNTIVNTYIEPITNFLAAGVGIIVVIMVVVGGIQYSTSAGNPQAAQAAKGRIINALIALVVFAFMYALLQWLIPGGIFHS